MIIIHGVPSMSQCTHLTLELLNYFPNHLLVNVKIIQVSHNHFQPNSIIIYKISLEESLYAQMFIIFGERIFQKEKNGKKP